MLSEQGDIVVIDAAPSGDEAIQQIKNLQPVELALAHNTKIVISTGSALVDVIGDMTGVVPSMK